MRWKALLLCIVSSASLADSGNYLVVMEVIAPSGELVASGAIVTTVKSTHWRSIEKRGYPELRCEKTGKVERKSVKMKFLPYGVETVQYIEKDVLYVNLQIHEVHASDRKEISRSMDADECENYSPAVTLIEESLRLSAKKNVVALKNGYTLKYQFKPI